MSQQNANQSEFNTIRIVILGISGALGGLACGYGGGIVAGANLYMHEIFPEMTIYDKQRFVSFAIITATISAFFSGKLMEKFGRYKTIILSDIFFILGNYTIAFASEIYHLYIGRLLIGVGLGLGMTVMTVYVAECSPNKLRGTLLSCCIMLVFMGMTLSYTMAVASNFNHQVLFCFIAIPAGFQILILAFLQGESPVYLVMKGRNEEAHAHIKRYYKINEQRGLQESEKHYEQIRSQTKTSEQSQSQIECYKELFSKYRWNLFMGVFLLIMQQMCGISLINYYGPKMLKDAGFPQSSRESLMISMIFLMAFNVIGNLSCTVLSKKYGRRKMILFAAPILFGALSVLTGIVIVSTQIGHFEINKWLSVLTLAVYLLFFSFGMASQPFTISAEIFPNHLRGVANSITGMSSWIGNYILAGVFLQLTSTDAGKIFTYSLLAFNCLIMYAFVWRFVPETKDRSANENAELVLKCYSQRYNPEKDLYNRNSDTQIQKPDSVSETKERLLENQQNQKYEIHPDDIELHDQKHQTAK
eukprot:403336889